MFVVAAVVAAAVVAVVAGDNFFRHCKLTLGLQCQSKLDALQTWEVEVAVEVDVVGSKGQDTLLVRHRSDIPIGVRSKEKNTGDDLIGWIPC